MSKLSVDDPLLRDVARIQHISAVATILRVVCTSTGLGFSVVARVTDDQWVACAVHDQLAIGLVPGATLEVATTLCSEVRDRRATVVMDHASLDPRYRDHRTPKLYGFESYISAPIFRLDGSFFGTLCAFDPKQAPVSAPKTVEQFELFAKLIALLLEAEDREAATVEANRRLESFVLGAPVAIAVLKGPDLQFELVNARFQALVGGGAVIGEAAEGLLGSTYKSPLWERLVGVKETGEPLTLIEYKSISPSAEPTTPGPRYLDVFAQATRNLEGAIDGVMLYLYDASSRVHARLELEQKNRDLDAFAYVASHDLKTPLRGISNLAQWIRQDAEAVLSPESKSHLDLLQRRTAHMNVLIESILKFARATQIDQLTTEVSVNDLLVELVDLLGVAAPARVTWHDALPTVRGSRVTLQQVFLNLVVNAIKHAGRPDVRVHIGVQEEPDEWVFSIEDNGPGVPQQQHDRIWQLFQTLTAYDEQGGTGIGLAIVKKLVEARRGRVWIESEPGAGATFSFTWPK